MFIVADCVSIAFLHVFTSALAYQRFYSARTMPVRTVHMNVLEFDDYLKSVD